jgi:hypothetical protein
MATKRILLALLLALITSGGAFAQSSAEFGRVSGGQMDLATKAPTRFFGSLGASMSSSNGSRNGLGGYGATLGGTVVSDRLWFFATTQRDDARRLSPALSQVPRFDTNFNAALGSAHSLGASFRQGRDSVTTTIPSSFLSMRYTGIVSSNMFFTANFARTSGRSQ